MAFHHHCHPTTTTTRCCCCSICTPSHYSSPSDPLVQSIASHLLHHPAPPPPQTHLYSPCLNPPYVPHNLHSHQTQYHPSQTHKQKRHSKKYSHQEDDEEQTLPIVSSLLRRIAALESSLRHQSLVSFSLRETAARTIQTHFRAFLVRRSRTLRQLKDLAFIKSALNTLKSSVSDNTHFDSQVLSHKAVDLLVKLDSIQGGDPMIRDGKRSISRELIHFMEFIDEVSTKRHVLSSRAVKNARFVTKNGTKYRVLQRDHGIRVSDCGGLDRNERELIEKLRNQVKKIHGFSRVSEEEEEEEAMELENPSISINGKCGVSQNIIGGLVKRQGGVQHNVKKNVSFVENGNVYRVFSSSHEPVSSGDSDSIDGDDSVEGGRQVDEIGVSSKETEEDNEEAQTEDEGSPQMSDDGSFAFYAPLPVKMESRADLMNKKQPVKM